MPTFCLSWPTNDPPLMPRRPAIFTEADLARAVKVAKSQGMAVEVTRDGTIRIVPSAPQPALDYQGNIRL